MAHNPKNDPDFYRLDLAPKEFNELGRAASASLAYAQFMRTQIAELAKAIAAGNEAKELVQAMLKAMAEATEQVGPRAGHVAVTLATAAPVWTRKGKLQ